MEKVILDTAVVDVVIVDKALVLKIEAGLLQGQIKLPIIELLKKLAAQSENKLDDAAVELIEKALS